MKKFIACSIFLALLSAAPKLSFAWGREGHGIVAQIAFSYLDTATKQKVMQYLNGMGIEDAASWMDDLRSDKQYDYLKPCHYLNLEANEPYVHQDNDNIVNELTKVINELNHADKLTDEQIRTDLLIVMHLVGDIHQPLHVGYGSDKGGNQAQVSFFGTGSNIHSVWDGLIIRQKNLTSNDCILLNNYNQTELIGLRKIDVIGWMQESRTYLPSVYSFKKHKIDNEYVDSNLPIIKRQLLDAGIRLAAVLESVFKNINRTPSFAPQVKEEIVTVDVNNLAAYEGKMVKVCTKIYGTKFMDNGGSKPTFLNAGAAYPNSPLTILIWGSNLKNFSNVPAKYYDGKNICVTGKVVMYKGSPEIIVSKEEEIEIVK